MWCIINGQDVEFESYNIIESKKFNGNLRLLQMEQVHLEDWDAVKKRTNIVMFEMADHYLCYKGTLFSHQVFPIFGMAFFKKFRLIFLIKEEYKAEKTMISEALELKELVQDTKNPELTEVKKEIKVSKYKYI